MKRRNFLKAGLLGAGAGMAAAPTLAAAAEKLPETQWKPAPDVGTHGEVFQRISAKCTASESFLEERFDDPAAWTELARATLSNCFHFTDTERELNPEVAAREDRGDFTRERVVISTTAGTRAALYLLVPKGLAAPAPGIVALHDHGGFYFWGKEKLTRVEPVHPDLQAFKDTYYSGNDIADELARRGYVVAVPDMLHWAARRSRRERPCRASSRGTTSAPQTTCAAARRWTPIAWGAWA